jgi:hypothetical protein
LEIIPQCWCDAWVGVRSVWNTGDLGSDGSFAEFLSEKKVNHMALKIDTTTPQGINVTSAYCRVEGISLTKTDITFTLRRYKDNSGLPFFMEEPFAAPYALTGVNPLQQAYDYLKTLPEFTGAVDVLEVGQPQ